jgi:thiamine phosphate synthase YjbQ (UPF0047 family)
MLKPPHMEQVFFDQDAPSLSIPIVKGKLTSRTRQQIVFIYLDNRGRRERLLRR